jgi:hypothetical protein
MILRLVKVPTDFADVVLGALAEAADFGGVARVRRKDRRAGR